MAKPIYVIVENAGYERETDCGAFSTYSAAVAKMERIYEPDEIESLHVKIAVELDGERSYDI